MSVRLTLSLAALLIATGCSGETDPSKGAVDVPSTLAFADAQTYGTDNGSTPDTTTPPNTDSGAGPELPTPPLDTQVAACSVDGTACNDQNLCTVNDQCIGGVCAGTPVDCNDFVPCTNDECVGGVCNNDILGDYCVIEGICYTLGAPNPQNGCETCQPGASQTAWTGTSTCDDGNPCTTNDKCTASGGCSGTPVICPDDGNPCTIESCVAGQCTTTQSPGPCEDGNPCTVGDVCVNQVCQPGAGLKDTDSDGAIDSMCGGTDCDDTTNQVAPGLSEVCNDGLDNDCNGQTDAADAICNQPTQCNDQVLCNDLGQVCGFWASVGANFCSPACAGLSDCAAGQTCTKMPGSATIGYCQDLVGTVPIGGECQSDAQCATYLCEFGFCLEPCLDQAGCTFPGDSCTPVGNLQQGPLRSACLADGELLSLGQQCINGQGQLDSGACGSGHCDLLNPVPTCAPLCTSEADCPPAQECNLVLYAEATNQSTIPVVQGVFQAKTHDAMMACYTAPSAGFKGLGEPCTNNAQCTSHKCLPLIAGNPTTFCTSFCQNDLECPTGMRCVLEVISLVDAWLQSQTLQTQPALPSEYTITRICKPD